MITPEIQVELSRRHRTTVNTIRGLIVGAILLAVVSYVGHDRFHQQSNAPLEMALMLVVLFLGLGSIVWRRTKFATMRLQDIGALEGPHGLLLTLEKTTLQLAMLAAAIALIGFIATLVTGNEGHTYRGSAIALVVLLYSYPTKTSWSRVVDYFGGQFVPGPETAADADPARESR